MSSIDLDVIWLTLRLAATVTLILLLVSIPLAWWLSQTRCRAKFLVGALLTLPMVLPPSVLGFYLLILMGPRGPVGELTAALGLGTLPFTFAGVVVAAVIHSLPFVIQPLQNTFEAIGRRPLEVAATLRASPWDTFLNVVMPLSRRGILTAGVLGFCHAIGEFGVILMIGGNIPGKTRVISVQIYNHVEALEYTQAHYLALGMLFFSFLALLIIYTWGNKPVRSAA